MKNINNIFESIGGKFLSQERLMLQKLEPIKAFVFDWDGVFNNAEKSAGGSSNFNEVDSMGTNLLRFSYYLQHSEIPVTAVISGENNQAAFYLCEREHFNANYYKISNKIEAIDHLCKQHNLTPKNVAYVFDDVLDLSVAKICGLKFLIRRNANPLFIKYVTDNNLADYITGNQSGNYAIREICELIIGYNNNYNKTISERINYSPVYKEYLENRNLTITNYFTKKAEAIIQTLAPVNPDNN